MKTTDEIKGKRREINRRAVSKYRRTAKGKQTSRKAIAKYRRTPKGKRLHCAANMKYDRTEKGRKQVRTRNKTYRLRHPDKEKARAAVTSAIRAGQLQPAKKYRCIYCGRDAIYYHHWHGYDKIHWVDVVPVCKKCDTEAHISLR